MSATFKYFNQKNVYIKTGRKNKCGKKRTAGKYGQRRIWVFVDYSFNRKNRK